KCTASPAQPKLSFQRFACVTGEAFKNDAGEAVCILVNTTAALVFFFIITEARANPAKPLRLLLRIALAFLPFGQKRKAGPGPTSCNAVHSADTLIPCKLFCRLCGLTI
ncbi:TPA: hypothetical protein ACW30V_004761, partial [Salmonella enterica subsp. enterica serovar Heidelberg]